MGQSAEEFEDASQSRAGGLADLAARLARARRETTELPDDPSALVTTVADAYAIQSHLATLAGGVRGWKVSAFTPAEQQNFRSGRPVAGPLLAPHVVPAPAAFALSQFVRPVIECEVAFVLGADLPPRGTPYERGEVEAAIEAAVAGIEIVDSRLPAGAAGLARLADALNNGAYVMATPVTGWRALDLTGIAIELSLDNGGADDGGAESGERLSGSSARILGNPLLAVLALANAQPLAGPGLKKGHVITTGSCTPPVPLRKGHYVAQFGPLGEIRLTVEPVKKSEPAERE